MITMKNTRFPFISFFFLPFMLFSQTHTATYGDKKYMVCTDKGFYTHCYAKHDLPDGKWMFYHPDTKKLAVVANVKNRKWNGLYYTYFENGSLATITNYQEDKRIGECRAYWRNGQMHFKEYNPNGFFIAYDTLGEIIRHESYSSDFSQRKKFKPIYPNELIKDNIPNDCTDTIFYDDLRYELIHHLRNNVNLFEIQSTAKDVLSEIKTQTDTIRLYIGISRNKLLESLGMDFYIMTESYIDYVLDVQNNVLVKISETPSYVLRCYFKNDVVYKIIIVTSAESLSYRSVCLILKEMYSI